MTSPSRARRLLVGAVPIMVVPLVLIAAAPWLKSIDRRLLLVASVSASLFVMGYAVYYSVLWQRALDEVQLAGQTFATRWGTTAGTMTFALLLMLPPFGDFATAFVIELGKPGPGLTVDRSVVTFAMTLGFMGVVLLQAIGSLVMNAIWWKTKQ
jgi:hypothetical protein